MFEYSYCIIVYCFQCTKSTYTEATNFVLKGLLFVIKLRLFVVLLAVWIVFLFNIERIDALSINLPTTLYVIAAIGIVPTLLFPATGQIRFEIIAIPVAAVYVLLRSLDVLTVLPAAVPGIVTETIILLITLWIGRRITINLEGFEAIVDDVVFDIESDRILGMNEGEQTVNNELFRARRYERPVSVIFIKLPSVGRLRRIHSKSTTFQYQLALEQKYYKTRIARIVESMVYQVDILVWYGDNLVICLPETVKEQADKLATQISDIINSSVILQVPMGTATFPSDGLIYRDLVATAKSNIKDYNTKDSEDDFGNNHPELKDDPLTITISSRENVVEQPSLSAFSKIREELQSFVAFLTNDIQLMPHHSGTNASPTEYMLYYDPDYWVNRIPYQSSSSRYIYDYVKRLIDLLAVILLSPFVLIIGACVAIAIKLDDNGPLFYSQKRTGLGGHKFKMYKFRSMVVDADKRLKELGVTVNERKETVDAEGNKLEYDPRITRVGRFIRKTSLDELPQLWNVFVGDMSLVGPRPTSFGIDKYQLFHTQRLNVKPGITGLWQIHDRGDTDFDNRLVWDIKYIDKYSLIMDVNILFRTVSVVLKNKGAS